MVAFFPSNGLLSLLVFLKQHGLAGFFLTKRQYPNKKRADVGREIPK